MVPYVWPAIVTLLALALMAWTLAMVARARGKFGIHAPATTGNAEFERIFRVQMNTLEASVLFLPALWLAAMFTGGILVPLAGLLWIGGRVHYALSYYQDPAKRSTGFGVAAFAFFVLVGDALFGIVRILMAG